MSDVGDVGNKPSARFLDLARKLAAVPKKELDQKRAEKPKKKRPAS